MYIHVWFFFYNHCNTCSSSFFFLHKNVCCEMYSMLYLFCFIHVYYGSYTVVKLLFRIINWENTSFFLVLIRNVLFVCWLVVYYCCVLNLNIFVSYIYMGSTYFVVSFYYIFIFFLSVARLFLYNKTIAIK
jgi:hypothetical protein